MFSCSNLHPLLKVWLSGFVQLNRMASSVQQAPPANVSPTAEVVCSTIRLEFTLFCVDCNGFTLCFIEYFVQCRLAMLLSANITIYCINRPSLFTGFTRISVSLGALKRMVTWVLQPQCKWVLSVSSVIIKV